MSGIDHFGYSVTDYDRQLAFYTAALKPLGIVAIMEVDEGGVRAAGLGANGMPFFWISNMGTPGGHAHVAFTAPTREAVDEFYAAALAAGGTDNGAPGVRTEYHPSYYAAFVLDSEGHNVEAVCHGPD